MFFAAKSHLDERFLVGVLLLLLYLCRPDQVALWLLNFFILLCCAAFATFGVIPDEVLFDDHEEKQQDRRHDHYREQDRSDRETQDQVEADQ